MEVFTGFCALEEFLKALLEKVYRLDTLGL
jgi:hypothetical protein